MGKLKKRILIALPIVLVVTISLWILSFGDELLWELKDYRLSKALDGRTWESDEDFDEDIVAAKLQLKYYHFDGRCRVKASYYIKDKFLEQYYFDHKNGPYLLGMGLLDEHGFVLQILEIPVNRITTLPGELRKAFGSDYTLQNINLSILERTVAISCETTQGFELHKKSFRLIPLDPDENTSNPFLSEEKNLPKVSEDMHWTFEQKIILETAKARKHVSKGMTRTEVRSLIDVPPRASGYNYLRYGNILITFSADGLVIDIANSPLPKGSGKDLLDQAGN